MNGPIAQIVALTCYGNAFLQGHSGSQFPPVNSTCQFCDRVTFIEVVKPFFGKQKECEIAKNPNEWFSYLQAKHARGIRLHSPENNLGIFYRVAAGFAGRGEAWTMEVLLPKEWSEFWMARWEVWDQKAPNQRIWRVTYGRIREAKSKASQNQSLQNMEERLLKALHDVHAFSEKNECAGFTEGFAKGIASLTGPERHGYHKDLAPAHRLETRAAAILDASQSAWVFGGMGSWNDMGFEGENQKEFNRVSDQLFHEVTQAICVAANSSLRKVEIVPANSNLHRESLSFSLGLNSYEIPSYSFCPFGCLLSCHIFIWCREIFR